MDVNVLVLCNQISNLQNYGINLYFAFETCYLKKTNHDLATFSPPSCKSISLSKVKIIFKGVLKRVREGKKKKKKKEGKRRHVWMWMWMCMCMCMCM